MILLVLGMRGFFVVIFVSGWLRFFFLKDSDFRLVSEVDWLFRVGRVFGLCCVGVCRFWFSDGVFEFRVDSVYVGFRYTLVCLRV